ncbi:MAG: SGNH/GDSL hydrolase family protein [Actinomycetota bacterium]|nr:SGNH/GDSL hydrolase family protein [Actinomycetota bacterium]
MAPRRVLRTTLRWLTLATSGLLGLLAIEALIATITVPDDGYRAPSPAPRTFGTADVERPRLRYIVLGDSTATGRGAPYERGIAVATAGHLAARRPVTLTNLAVSGARFGDVRRDQLPAAVRSRPDVVLVAAGANDVTGLSRLRSVRADLEEIVARLRAARCDVAIVVTASPDVGAVPRLAQPLRAVAGWRTDQVNGAIEDVVRERGLVLAPIAAHTGPLFRADRSLFAADDFHPSAAGYATWVPVIEAALDRALVRHADTTRGCQGPIAQRGAALGVVEDGPCLVAS